MKRLLAVLAMLLPVTAGAGAASKVQIGTLDCAVGPGKGLIFRTVRELKCEFVSSSGGVEPYFGVVERFGLEIGSTERSVIKWIVLASTLDGYRTGGLAGDYTGVSAEVTAGAGLGANALVGRSEDGFILQPLSVQGQEGLNLAAGISVFQLRSM